jgi:hypothetical protein
LRKERVLCLVENCPSDVFSEYASVFIGLDKMLEKSGPELLFSRMGANSYDPEAAVRILASLEKNVNAIGINGFRIKRKRKG